jgi:DNA (cytosine-5)-methyltransferase 1
MKIREAAEHLGVSIETLRRWNGKGVIRVDRTPLGYRIFKPESILEIQHIIRNRQRSSLSGERP